MTTKYEYRDFVFDVVGLRKDVRQFCEAHDLTGDELNELVGKLVWGALHQGDYHPTCRTLLKICNLMDVDPRRYFVLSYAPSLRVRPVR